MELSVGVPNDPDVSELRARQLNFQLVLATVIELLLINVSPEYEQLVDSRVNKLAQSGLQFGRQGHSGTGSVC